MLRHFERQRKLLLSGGPVIPDRKGQVLLETLALAVFFVAFFGVLINFAGDTHKKMENARWSAREKRENHENTKR